MRIIIYSRRRQRRRLFLASRGSDRSERFRRQFHGGRASGLDAREVQRRFRQHPFHEEAAGHQLGGQIGGSAGARNLVLGYLRHLRPHIAESDEAEQLHVIGGGGAGVVGLG